MKSRNATMLVPFLCLAISSTGWAYTASDYTWITNPSNGHSYAHTLEYASWPQSEAWAHEVGGHLVTIDDLAENAWLSTQFQGLYRQGLEGQAPHSLVWIGLYNLTGQYDVDSDWLWVSGESLTIAPPWDQGKGVLLSSEGGMPYAYLHTDTHGNPRTWLNHDWSLYNPSFGIIEVNSSGTVIPVPGALPLGGIGMGVVGWLRRRKAL